MLRRLFLLQCLSEFLNYLVYVFLLRHQRRRHNSAIAGELHMHSVPEEAPLYSSAARAWRAFDGDVDPDHQPYAADVSDNVEVFWREDSVQEVI